MRKLHFPGALVHVNLTIPASDTFVLSYPKCPWPHFWKAHAWLQMPCSLFKQAADLWNTDERQKIVIILPFYDWFLLKINVSRLIPLLTEILSSTKHNLRRLVSLAWYFHCFVTGKDPNHGEQSYLHEQLLNSSYRELRIRVVRLWHITGLRARQGVDRKPFPTCGKQSFLFTLTCESQGQGAKKEKEQASCYFSKWDIFMPLSAK